MRKKNLIVFFTLIFFLVATSKVSASEFDFVESSLSQDEISSLEEKGYTLEMLEMYLENDYDFERLMEMEVVGIDETYAKYTETVPFGYEDIEDIDDVEDLEEIDFVKNVDVDKFNDNITDFDNTELLINTLLNEDIIEFEDSQIFGNYEEISYEDYIKGIEEEEIENPEDTFTIFASHSTSTSYKVMKTYLTKINKDKYQITNELKWSKMPKNRKNDVIAVGINSQTSPIPGTESAKQTWSTLSGASKGSATYTKNSPKWERSSGGYGLWFKLKSNRTAKAPWRNLKMYMEYQIRPNNSNVTYIDAYGDFRHQETVKNIEPSFSIGAGGVGISFAASQSSKFTKHPNTHVQVKR